jgi:hypothetical protein
VAAAEVSVVRRAASSRVLLAAGLIAAAVTAHLLGPAALGRLQRLPEGVAVPNDLAATALWPFAVGEVLAGSAPLAAPLVRPLPVLAALVGLVLGMRILLWALGAQRWLAILKRWRPLTRDGRIGIAAEVLTGRRYGLLVLEGMVRAAGAIVVWSLCWYLVGAGMSRAADWLRETSVDLLEGSVLLLVSVGAWAGGLAFSFPVPVLLVAGTIVAVQTGRAYQAALRRWWTRLLAEGGEPPAMTRLAALEWKLRRRLLGRKAYLLSSIGTPEVMDLLDALADSALSAAKRTGASGVPATRMHAAGAAEEG